jgi:ankyrin repeat protein
MISFYPFVPREISVLIELTSRHTPVEDIVREDLYAAIIRNSVEMCRAIRPENVSLALRSRFRSETADGACPLHLAVFVQGRCKQSQNQLGVEVVEWLLKSGASLEVQDVDGWTPMSTAILNGNVRIVSLLEREGASLACERIDRYGRSALHFACLLLGHAERSSVCIEMVHWLIEKGADVSIKDNVCNLVLYHTSLPILHCVCVCVDGPHCSGPSVTLC